MFRTFFFQAEDGTPATSVTGVQTCALPIFLIAMLPTNPSATSRSKWPKPPRSSSSGPCVRRSRSEERRVGQEAGRARWPEQTKDNKSDQYVGRSKSKARSSVDDDAAQMID